MTSKKHGLLKTLKVFILASLVKVKILSIKYLICSFEVTQKPETPHQACSIHVPTLQLGDFQTRSAKGQKPLPGRSSSGLCSASTQVACLTAQGFPHCFGSVLREPHFTQTHLWQQPTGPIQCPCEPQKADHHCHT